MPPTLRACLRVAALALLGSCAAETTEDVAACFPSLISPRVLYAAYDGVHEFSVTPSVPSARADSLDSDPVDGATIRWRFDPAFFTAAAFSGLPGAVKLTTKRAGETQIEMVASTVSGATVRDKGHVLITELDAGAWEIGDARYRSGAPATWGNFPLAQQGEGSCGLPYTITVPTTAACVSCHDNRDETSIEYTPTQTAVYSDEDLLNITRMGSKPPGDSFISPHLMQMPMPDCVFSEFHAFEITEPEKQGLISRLRSIPPSVVD